MSYTATVTRQPLQTLLNLRGDANVGERFSDALGIALPQQPNTVVSSANVDVLWLGPDEWLLKAPETDEQALEKRLLAAVEEQHAAVTLVSDHYIVFRLSGEQAAVILQQASSIDSHSSQLAMGQCVRCGFARTRAIIQVIDDMSYDVFIEATYTPYLEQWFAVAIGN